MKINKLIVKKFRCFDDKEISLSNNNVIFYGPNAIGKTSLLEAIYCLGVIKSYRCFDQREIIKNGEDHFYIEGLFSDETKTISSSLFVNNEIRKINLNHSGVKKAIDYIGKFNVVSFAATDFLIFKGSTSDRRKMFDVIICQISKNYYQTSNNYKKLLKSRNTLLKRLILENRQDLYDVLQALDSQIIESGLSLIKMRKKFVNKLNEYVDEVHFKISGKQEHLTIQYISWVDEENYEIKLKNSLKDDLKRGYTTVGPHTDDYLFMINENNAAKFGSQGQQRNALLSTKLAMANLIGDTTNNYPIVLLDDVFSELDKSRQNALISNLNPNYQHIITTASLSDLDDQIINNNQFEIIDVSKI